MREDRYRSRYQADPGYEPGGRGGRGRHGGRGGRGEPEFSKHRIQGAQTFRRGRAVAFLETLHVRRATLARQLNEPEFEAIKPVISGELKAVDAIIQEFIHMFELHESPEGETE